MTYEEYIEQNILHPLGMSSTGFNYTDRQVVYMHTTYVVPNCSPLIYWCTCSHTCSNLWLYSVLQQLATGYMSDGSPEPVYDVGWWGPAGQMYSTLQDLNKVCFSHAASIYLYACCAQFFCVFLQFARFFYSVGGVQRTEDPVSPEVLSPTMRRLMILPSK